MGRTPALASPADFSARQQPRSDEVLTDAVVTLCGHLGLSASGLGKVLGVSRSQASRIIKGEKSIKAASREGECALLLVRLYRSLAAILGGNIEQAREWMSSENHALGGRPQQLIGNIEGLVHVCDYLDAMRGP